MTWYGYLKAHGQRPRSWFQLVTPTYWRQLQRERTATLHSHTEPAPCGHTTVTQYKAADGTVIRQDVTIHITQSALSKVAGGL